MLLNKLILTNTNDYAHLRVVTCSKDVQRFSTTTMVEAGGGHGSEKLKNDALRKPGHHTGRSRPARERLQSRTEATHIPAPAHGSEPSAIANKIDTARVDR